MTASELQLREINLEIGRPFVEQAMLRLKGELPRSRSMGCTVVKVIHGYGSSGSSGRIRTETRKYLKQIKKERQIADFIPGESFSIFEEATRTAFATCAALRRDPDLDRYNNGVTFILL